MPDVDVLILSASFGSGHRTVSEAVKKELEETYNLKVFIEDLYELMNPKLNRINAAFYIKLMRYASTLYGLFYDLTYDLKMDNFLNKTTSYIGRKELLKLLETYKPKVVVSTYPTYTGILSYLKGEKKMDLFSITIITDFVAHSQWIHKHVDAYFVASDEVALNLIKKGISSERIHVSGIPIRKAFNQDCDTESVREKYGIEKEVPLILVMNLSFGNPQILKEVCEVINSLNLDFKALVLCGKDEKLYKIASSFGRKIKPLQGTFNIAELMSISKILITKSGGITTSEGLAKNLPMIFYKPVPGQEWHNADYVSRHGAGIIVKEKYELKNILYALLTKEELYRSVREKAKSIAKPYATEYVAKYINDVILKL